MKDQAKQPSPKRVAALQAKLEELDAQIAREANAPSLLQRHYEARRNVSVLEDQAEQTAKNVAHSESAAQEVKSRKPAAEEKVQALRFSVERMARLVRPDMGAGDIVTTLLAYDDAIEGLEFFIQSHPDKVAATEAMVARRRKENTETQQKLVEARREVESLALEVDQLTKTAEAAVKEVW